MTDSELRDHFAALAMASLLRKPYIERILAENSYKIAQAMMIERRKYQPSMNNVIKLGCKVMCKHQLAHKVSSGRVIEILDEKALVEFVDPASGRHKALYVPISDLLVAH